MRTFLIIALLSLFMIPATTMAQQNTIRYENDEIGVSFDIPADWVVRTENERLMAGTEASLNAFDNNTPPQGLLFSIVVGAFGRLPIDNITQLPEQLQTLVPEGITTAAPAPVTYGNVTGFEVEYTIPDSSVTTRVALVSIPGGRAAVIRGLSDSMTWESTNRALFDRIIASMQFGQSTTMADPYSVILSTDGGVFWHYQTGQPTSGGPPLDLGGIVYDSFGVMYIAAGPRGFLALSQEDGSFINFLGPLRDDDNLVDVTISTDERLYFANASTGDNERIMAVDRVGNFIRSWGDAGEEPGQFAPNMPQTISISQRGDIWTVSEGHTTAPEKRLYHFDSFGNFLGMIDLDTINPDLQGVHLDYNWASNNIVLVGRTGGINLLDANGTPLVTRVNMDLLDAAAPLDIAVASGDVVVISTENEGFLAFTTFGELLDRFAISYDETRRDAFQPGEYYQPQGVAVSNSTVYFAETHPETGFSQVQAFSFSGEGILPLAARPGETDTAEGPSTPLQNGGTISYGMTVRGEITNQSSEHDYTFEAQAGDRLVITMKDASENGQLDTTISLLNFNYDEIAYNDDVTPPVPAGLRGTDSRLTYVVNSTGTYVIRATRFGGNGIYELTLEQE